MISQLELYSRVRLCRQLAKREPANRAFWMDEAGIWSRLSKEKLRGEAGAETGSGILARLQAWWARRLSSPALARVACMKVSRRHQHHNPSR